MEVWRNARIMAKSRRPHWHPNQHTDRKFILSREKYIYDGLNMFWYREALDTLAQWVHCSELCVNSGFIARKTRIRSMFQTAVGKAKKLGQSVHGDWWVYKNKIFNVIWRTEYIFYKNWWEHFPLKFIKFKPITAQNLPSDSRKQRRTIKHFLKNNLIFME